MPTRSKAATTVSETSELAGQKPSFTALPNWLLGKASALEIAVLWVLQSHYPEIRPSITRLATCANLSRRTVFNVLADLERKGWLVRVHREFESGKKAPNLYRLTIWDGEPKAAAGASGDGAPRALVQEMHQGDGAPRARRMVQEMHHDGAPRAHEVDQVEEEQLEVEDSPSIPLTATQPAAPDEGGQTTVVASPDPAPEARHRATAAKPKAKGGKPKATKVNPQTADLPESLQCYRQQIADFWSAKRSGSAKTPAAFKLLLTNLLRIQADDPAAVGPQLDKATQAGFRSITHENWLKYGRPAALQVGTGSGPRYASRRERQQAEVEQALDLLALIDPEFADPDRLDRLSRDTSTTTATIDWEAMPRA